MEAVQYFRLVEGEPLPDFAGRSPFKAIVVSDIPCTPAWRDEVSSWLVAQGCLYIMAWGHECSAWDDAVDQANIDAQQGDIPDGKFVLTTWHEDESLEEVFWFAKFAAKHPDVELAKAIILDISQENRFDELVTKYEDAGAHS